MKNILERLLFVFNITLLPKALLANRNLLFQVVQRNITGRYRGAFLGLLWSFVQPLMMLTVYTFVFSVIFKARWGVDVPGGASQGGFAVIMFCGIALFNIFSESVMSACACITSNPNFVKKVVFPLDILPFAQTLSSFAFGLVWILLLFLGAVFILDVISFKMLLLPLILLELFIFSLGISYFVASMTVFVRDTQYVVGVVLQILFFMTPIFYPLEMVPAVFQKPLQLNPLTIMIEQARNVFLYDKMPDWSFLGGALLVSLLVMQLGFAWFYKTKKGFADVL